MERISLIEDGAMFQGTLILLALAVTGNLLNAWGGVSRGLLRRELSALGGWSAIACMWIALFQSGWMSGIIVVIGAVISAPLAGYTVACFWCKLHPDAVLLTPRRHAFLLPTRSISHERHERESHKARAMAVVHLAMDSAFAPLFTDFGRPAEQVMAMLESVNVTCGPLAAQLLLDQPDLLLYYLEALCDLDGNHREASVQLARALGWPHASAAITGAGEALLA
jgi:hypothetical protein